MKLLRHQRDGDAGMISCRKVGKVLQQFLDGELDEITGEQVEAHLEMCRRCGMEADVYREIKSALARSGAEVPSDALVRLRSFGEELARGSAGEAGS